MSLSADLFFLAFAFQLTENSLRFASHSFTRLRRSDHLAEHVCTFLFVLVLAR